MYYEKIRLDFLNGNKTIEIKINAQTDFKTAEELGKMMTEIRDFIDKKCRNFSEISKEIKKENENER